MLDLIERLLESPHDHDLFQAMSLLERAHPERRGLGTSLGLDEAAQLVADPSLAFPSADITEVRSQTEGEPPHALKTAVLTLAGAQGPLPVSWTEQWLALQRRRETAPLEFLDVFNQRLLAFLYRSRRKHRPSLSAAPAPHTAFGRVLQALGGVAAQPARNGPTPAGPPPWLRHTALQAGAPRSMASLLALLSDRMGVALRGRSFIGAWLPVPDADRASLAGQGKPGTRLGGGHSLGCRAWDPGAEVELILPPRRGEQLQAWLPGHPAHGLMADLVQSHLQSPIQARLRIPVEADHLPSLALGADGPRLGLTAWLSAAPGSARSPDAVAVALRSCHGPAGAA